MDKQKYYVSVQAGTIMSNQGEAAYELEIKATPEEIEKLKELFEERTGFDDLSFFRAHLPGIPYHLDEENDGHDYYLASIYRMIYDLGTQETQEFIKTMNVLD